MPGRILPHAKAWWRRPATFAIACALIPAVGLLLVLGVRSETDSVPARSHVFEAVSTRLWGSVSLNFARCIDFPGACPGSTGQPNPGLSFTSPNIGLPGRRAVVITVTLLLSPWLAASESGSTSGLGGQNGSGGLEY